MYVVHMPTVKKLLGIHTYTLLKYGVAPEDDWREAVEKLYNKAPHRARLLEEIGAVYTAAGGI